MRENELNSKQNSNVASSIMKTDRKCEESMTVTNSLNQNCEKEEMRSQGEDKYQK